MLIQALNDYYYTLKNKGEIGTDGYAGYGISYLISLTADGQLAEIIDCRVKVSNAKTGKETMKPKEMVLPARPKKTTIDANFVEVRAGYIFGLEYRSDKKSKSGFLTTESEGPAGKVATEQQKAKVRKQHESFVQEVERDFGDIQSPIAQAYVNFAKTWKPYEQVQNEYLLNLKADLNSAKFVFCLDGHPEIMLQDDPIVKQKWDEQFSTQQAGTDAPICQCAITGEMLPVAMTHEVVQVPNAGINPTIVNFKPESFMSYGHKQGENGCISVMAMQHYTTALNWMLKSPKNHSSLDDMTVFFWSSDGNDIKEQTVWDIFANPHPVDITEILDSDVASLMRSVYRGTVTEEYLKKTKQNITPDTQFYIVGLEPNVSRIQIKFEYRQTFGKLLENVAKHQRDMKIRTDSRPVSINTIKEELTSPKITNQEAHAMTPINSMFQSIINGTEYPYWCLNTVLTRIRTDRDTEDNKFIRVNDVRAGLVKACIIRHTREEIAIALDLDNTNPAYLCGRLFACLEKTQKDASTTKLNRTIADSYFSSAMTTPAVVFPEMMVLAKHHLAKIEKSDASWKAAADRKLQEEIISKMKDAFPRTLNIYDQGRFVIGYYQQREDFYKKNEKPACGDNGTDTAETATTE